jgi:hypothetical protein
MTRRAMVCAAAAVLAAPGASGSVKPRPAPAPLIQQDEILHISLGRDALMSIRDQAEEWVTMSQGEIAGDGDWLISVLLHGKAGMTREQLIGEVERFLGILYSSAPLVDPGDPDGSVYPCTVLDLFGDDVRGLQFWK